MAVAIPIWQPKYCTKTVLVDTLKVRDGKNYLFFCCDKKLNNNLYSFDGTKVKSDCGLISNGKIMCYDIPLDYLNLEGDLPNTLKSIRDLEYNKYRKLLTKRKEGK